MLSAVKTFKDYILGLRTIVKLDNSDEESIDGKIIIVTGANSGIGKATTTELAQRGATVIMACRNLDQAQIALEDIRKVTDKGELVLMKLDLEELDSIRQFVKEFKEKYNKLNILINNAGVSDQNGTILKSKEGFEFHMGINHLGHFLLTNLLLDSLKAGAPSRVVSVASLFYTISNLNFDDLMFEKSPAGFANLFPYGNSKLANMLFIKELAKRIEGSGVTAYAVCPGMTDTNVFRTQPSIKSFITKMSVKLVGFTPEQGCQTTLYCSLSKKLGNESGKMYRFGHLWENAIEDLSDEAAKKLWDVSEILVGLKKRPPPQD